jgi:TolB-like protein
MSRQSSFWSELKRRKVVRVAIVYAATAFAVLQAADIMLPRMGIPDWGISLVVALAVLGFPIALVLAWALEVTPEGIRRTEAVPGDAIAAPPVLGKRTILVAVLLVVLGIGMGAGWFLKPASPVPAEPVGQPDAALAAEGEPVPAGPGEKSIAVLPFVNMSADAENEFFADGISEELLNVLVRVEDIGVASRTSSFAYKGRELGAAAIARELKVDHILEGSVRKAGNRVRITAQLIDAVNDRHLWSETYDRELTDIFAIQDEIANAIVAALRGTLGAGSVERAVTVRADTDNLDAYQLYLKARELFLTRSQLDESVRLFGQAVALDPEFARGWEGLAAASAVIIDWVATYPMIDTVEQAAVAEHAIERALALDPSLSMPWAARALLVNYKLPMDFAASLELLERAVAADPKNATAYLWRSILWVYLGYLDRALADQELCLSIDPAYGNCLRWKALTLVFKGEGDAALPLFEKGVANGFITNRADTFVELLLQRGDRLAALLLMHDSGWPLEIQQAVIASYDDGVPLPDVTALIQRYPERTNEYLQWYLLLRAYDLAAEDEALRLSFVQYWDPAHGELRNLPAFKRMLERLGVSAYWREHGYPPQCRPVGEQDFECPP